MHSTSPHIRMDTQAHTTICVSPRLCVTLPNTSFLNYRQETPKAHSRACCGSSEMAAVIASSAMRVKGDDYVGDKLRVCPVRGLLPCN